MDSNYLKLHLTVDRYLRGTLKDDEKAAFEERLLWDEELVDEVDLANHLREGLQAVAREPAVESVHPNFLGWLSSFLLVPQYAAAASFLLAAILTTAVFMNPFTKGGSGIDFYTAQTEVIPLFVTRGGDSQTIRVAADDWAVLLVDVVGGFDVYRATVRQGDVAEPIWINEGLTPTYPEAIALGMPGSVLRAGNYVLKLEGARVADSGARSYEHIQEIPFTVASAQ
ncbi:MAG: hypothetical protein KJO19_04440 [Woeseia sp.]|nr:hypothetical protein [Woeseia sp.]